MRPASLRTLVAILFALGVAGVVALPAAAEFGPIRLVSRSAAQQAGEAVAPAISADGRYLAFQGTIGGREGRLPQGPAERQPSHRLPPAAPTKRAPRAAPPRRRSPPTAATSPSPRRPSSTPATTLSPARGTSTSPTWPRSPPSYELASALDGSSARPHLRHRRRLGSHRPGRAQRRRAQGRVLHHRDLEPDRRPDDDGQRPPARSRCATLDSRPHDAGQRRTRPRNRRDDRPPGARGARSFPHREPAAAARGGAQRRRHDRRLAGRPPAGPGAAARRGSEIDRTNSTRPASSPTTSRSGGGSRDGSARRPDASSPATAQPTPLPLSDPEEHRLQQGRRLAGPQRTSTGSPSSAPTGAPSP